MNKMRIVAIIQARMGSTRLPGKVLKLLAGKPVLWHIIHRLRKCRKISVIAIATSHNPKDDPLEEFASAEGITVVRGSEDNVLERYTIAAKKLNADIILRVTGDAPLIDPNTIDRMVEQLLREEADYCCCDPNVEFIHEGFNPFTFAAIQKLNQKAADDPVAIEHVTAYFKLHPEHFKIVYVDVPMEYRFCGARISVDTPADLQFLEEVYKRLRVPAGEIDVRDVVRLLRSDPDLLNINSHIHQKTAIESSRKILFRCDGDSQIGLGHVYRCIALADELREKHACGVVFAMIGGKSGRKLIQEADYPVEYKQNDTSEGEWLDEIISKVKPDALLLDVRTDLQRSSLERWRDNGVLIVTIDDPSERRLAADLVFCPPVPGVRLRSWSDFTGQLFVDWKWVPLRREFSQRPSMATHDQPTVLATMGGSDPSGFTIKVVKALNLLDEDFDIIVVLGSAFSQTEILRKTLTNSKHNVELQENVKNMPAIMTRADIAIASFGVTAYELAAMEDPAIYLCLTENHVQSASAFVEAGMAISLGVGEDVSTQELAQAASELLENETKRLSMTKHARQLVDGRGAERITCKILERINNSNV